MRVLHWAFVLVAIVLPISIICRNLVNARFSALKDEVRINNAIDTATKDAIDQIITANGFYTSGFDSALDFEGVIDITPALAQESINTFFHTMAVNYNIPYKTSDTTELSNDSKDSKDSYIKNYFASYVPAVVVIAYDGFYVYSIESDESGYHGYQLSSKIPYTFDAGEYIIGYTLGEDIYLYVKSTGNCYSGKFNRSNLNDISGEVRSKYYDEWGVDTPDDIALLTNDMDVIVYALTNGNKEGVDKVITQNLQYIQPSVGTDNFLQDYENGKSAGAFHTNRRSTIIKRITDCLNEKFNQHNNYADMYGITYNFSLPEIPEGDWVNTINDISVLAFVQGIPIGTAKGNFYNNYALGGSQIVQKDFLYGKENDNGVKLYHKAKCPSLNGNTYESIIMNNDDSIMIFMSEEDAIDNGYIACQLCN